MFKRFLSLPSAICSGLTKRPVVSFFALLVLLFGLIVLGTILRAPQETTDAPLQENKKSVIFDPSRDTAFLAVSAEVKKTDIIDIVALAPGIVSAVRTAPGQAAYAGQTLVELTNDYQSGSTDIQKQIAANDAFLTEKLARIDKRLFVLQEKLVRRDDTLTDTAEEIELKQLNKDRAESENALRNSALNLRLANANDAVLKPKTFVSGIVERLPVKRGDFVSSGDTLVTLRATSGTAVIEALVSRKTAALFDPTHAARLMVGTETITLMPSYFSHSETENGLFSIVFPLSETTKNRIGDGEFVRLELPLRAATPSSLLVPIDAVFQDDTAATVLVEEAGIATAKPVVLGNIYGSFVEIISGLSADAHIILNRSVIAGDPITTVAP